MLIGHSRHKKEEIAVESEPEPEPVPEGALAESETYKEMIPDPFPDF